MFPLVISKDREMCNAEFNTKPIYVCLARGSMVSERTGEKIKIAPAIMIFSESRFVPGQKMKFIRFVVFLYMTNFTVSQVSCSGLLLLGSVNLHIYQEQPSSLQYRQKTESCPCPHSGFFLGFRNTWKFSIIRQKVLIISWRCKHNCEDHLLIPF
jgi:hypothetical protein